MSIYISLTPFGLFAHDERENLKASIVFNIDTAKESFKNSMQTTLSKEDKELIKKLGTKDDNLMFEIQKDGYKSEFPNISGNIVRENLSKLALSINFCKNYEEFYLYINDLNAEITRESVKIASTEDRLLVHAINTIDELESTANTLAIRLKEWYGLYNPEFVEKVRSNEKLTSLISQTPKREDLSEDQKSSMGGDYKDADIIPMQRYAELIDTLYRHKKEIETYVDEKARELMPNVTQIISPTLAARLLADAGSLEKLAKLPSSTIQVMGAEKALFRHILGQGPSPKHGLIFQAPVINQAQKKVRGKLSRMLASTLSIAYRMDYFDKELTGGELLKEKFDKKIKNIKG